MSIVAVDVGGGHFAVNRLVVRTLILAVAIGATAALLPGLDLDPGMGALLWVTALFLGANLLVRGFVSSLEAPVSATVLGSITLIVNLGLLLFTSWLTADLDIDGLWPAFWGAVVISTVAAGLEARRREG